MHFVKPLLRTDFIVRKDVKRLFLLSWERKMDFGATIHSVDNHLSVNWSTFHCWITPCFIRLFKYLRALTFQVQENEYALHNVSMSISNPEVEAGDKTEQCGRSLRLQAWFFSCESLRVFPPCSEPVQSCPICSVEQNDRFIRLPSNLVWSKNTNMEDKRKSKRRSGKMTIGGITWRWERRLSLIL